MQYLLTAQEYDMLKTSAQKERDRLNLIIQKLCTMVADNKPCLWGWSDDEEPRVWICIRTAVGEHYCDCCPVEELCPYTEKHYGK